MTAAIAAVAMFFGTQVKAQSTNAWRMGIGVDGFAPTSGILHTVSSVGVGGTLRLQYGADKGLGYTLTSGYYNGFGKDAPGGGHYTSFGIVPLKAGIKGYIADKLYLGAEVGAGFETATGGSTKLVASPTLGYSTSSLDFGVHYDSYMGGGNTYGLIGLRVAYGFKL